MTELTHRPYADSDAAPIADLLNAIEAANGGEWGYTEAEIRATTTGLIADVARDSRVVLASGGALVAVGMVGAPPPGGSRADTFGGVHPQWRGRGLGRELLAWQLARIAEMYAEQSPGIGWHVDAGASVDDTGSIRLFERFGMRPARYYLEMYAQTADARSVPPPDGVRIVPYTAVRLPALYDAHLEAFADYWGFQPLPMEKWAAITVEAGTFRPDLSRIAFDETGDGAEIVAYLLSHDGADGRLYISHIGTRRRWRKRGLASAMLAEALVAGAKAGKATASLGVDADSPTGAGAVYERAGFTIRHAPYVAYHKPLSA